MPRRLALSLYNALIYAATLPVLVYLLLRSRRDPQYRKRLSERFAWQAIPERAMGGIVVHAVSVGEVVAATPLIRALQRRYPSLPLTVTCTTPTGSARIVQTLPECAYHCYLPLDTPGAVVRFLDKLQPQAVVLLETELWPNLLQQCRRALIPTIVANARLSATSASGYRRWHAFSRLALDNISLLLAQDAPTARRLKALGCSGEIRVAGNLKYDMAVPAHLDAVAAALREQVGGRRIWVAGSTHAGEDEQLIEAYRLLKPRLPDLLLILVPRHPERFDPVAQLLHQAGLSTVRRSEQRPVVAGTQVLLADTMGELLAWYQLADVVFIGGSLIARGGHSPLEAMRFGKPIQSGPHVFNFQTAYRWLDQEAAVSWTADVAALVDSTTRLLDDPVLANAQGNAAAAVYHRHAGASERMADAIVDILGADAGELVVQQQAGETRWYDRSVFSQPAELSFDPAEWHRRQAVIGRSQGRSTAWYVRHDGTAFVLRHYFRGGWIGRLVEDRFLHRPALHSRARQEFFLLRHMRRCGLPVPRPLAAGYRRQGWCYRADLIIGLVAGSTDLAQRLASGASLTAAQWEAVGATIARLHRAGVDHADLNCHNILIDGEGGFWLIDFDKSGLRPAGPWRERNLARLRRSLDKERRLNASFGWHAGDWAHVLKGYARSFGS
jgi:3-deoxy-D-manno-octulosonic-acid transferase